MLGIPPTPVPISPTTFVSYILPPLACYVVAAVLVITPQTRTVRVAFWPIITLLAFRAAVSVDMAQGGSEKKFFSMQLVVCIFQHVRHMTADFAISFSESCQLLLCIPFAGQRPKNLS